MKKNNQLETGNLRQKAEERLKNKLSKFSTKLSEAETLKLMHELEVHQIELEIQNEELILAKEQAAMASENYIELFDFAPSGLFKLSPKGEIIQLNLAGAAILGKARSQLKNRLFHVFASDDSKPIFLHFLEKVFKSHEKEICELTLTTQFEKPLHVYIAGIVHKNSGHCLLTVIDITDKKYTEASLIASEEKYHAIFDNVQDVFYQTDLAGTVLEVSPSIKHFSDFNRDEIIGQPVTNLYYDNNDRDKLIGLLKEKGEFRDYELRLKTKTGKLKYVSNNARLIYDADGTLHHIDGAIRDITERKQAEIKLQESKDFLNNIINAVASPVFVKDKNHRYVLVNNALSELLKIPVKEIIGSTDSDYFPEEQMKVFIAKDDEVFETGNQNINEEFFTDGTGNIRTVVASKTLYTDNAGNKFLVGVINDITERKLAEIQIKKLNRVYEVLSNINKTIVRIHNKQFLLDEACRIAVDNGGFIMAFIGFINPRTNNIDVAASSGVIGEYLKNININLNDKKRSSGPIGLAIKSGKSNFSNNIQCDDKMVPWRNDAIKHGYRSSIALPLIVSGETIGVYMIYSNEIGFFNKDEIKLLEELAFDISFALEFIESEKERKQAEEALKENNSRLELAMHSANMAWWEMDIATGNVIFDKRKSEMIGYPAKKCKQYKDFMAFVHPEDTDKAMKAMQKHIDGLADKYEAEYRILTKSGEYKWFYDIGFIIKKDSNGIPLNITGLVMDITSRKKAELALRASELKYHNIFNNVQDVFYQTDLVGNVLEISPSIKHFSDFNRDEIIGKPATDLYVDPNDRVVAFGLLHEKGELRDYELRLKTKTGKIKFTSINARLIYDSEGNPNHIDGAIRDITDRKQIQEKLIESEERFNLAMEASKDGLFDWNLETNEIYYSPRWKKIIGYEDHELLNKLSVWENATVPSGVKESWELYQKLLTKEIDRFVLEFKMKHKDGHWVDILSQANAVFNEDGKAIRIVGIHTNISERKKAEEALLILKTAIEKSEVSVVITNADGNIEYANPFFTKQTGYTRKEYFGQNSRVLKSGHQPKSFYKKMWNTIKSGNTWEGKFYNRKKNGEFYWEQAIISPIENDKNQITHFVAVKTDITESKKINEELIIAKEHAEESDRLKSAFLANMSHEIRTPMNGILGFTELLKEPDLSEEEQKYYISIIEKSGARLLNIINDIIDISKIESGQMNVNLSKVNVNEYLELIYGFFKPEAEKRNINLSFIAGLPWEKAFLETDSDKFYAILTNLVKNALKYTETGFVEFGYVTKLLTVNKNLVSAMEFYVKDSGIGIPRERQKAIFQRFVQADIMDKMARQGAGLGLSISKAYVEMLGGTIWVESKAEDLSAGKAGGSTFYFTLPAQTDLKTEKNTNIELLNQKNDKRDKGLKILIAEDDAPSSKLTSIAVGKFGKDIINVQTGTEAVEVCRNNPDIDLILMDIQMPEMNGYEATRQIRQFNTDVIIIAVTAFALTGDREKAIMAGCNDYISKPIKKNELNELIQRNIKV